MTKEKQSAQKAPLPGGTKKAPLTKGGWGGSERGKTLILVEARKRDGIEKRLSSARKKTPPLHPKVKEPELKSTSIDRLKNDQRKVNQVPRPLRRTFKMSELAISETIGPNVS